MSIMFKFRIMLIMIMLRFLQSFSLFNLCQKTLNFSKFYFIPMKFRFAFLSTLERILFSHNFVKISSSFKFYFMYFILKQFYFYLLYTKEIFTDTNKFELKLLFFSSSCSSISFWCNFISNFLYTKEILILK